MQNQRNLMMQTWIIDQKPGIWANLGPICPNLSQIIFFLKIGLRHFFPLIEAWLDAKNQRNPMISFREKLVTDRRTNVWRNGKLSINAPYSSYLPMASNQTIKDRLHQRQWWVGRVSLVSTYLPVLNPGRWKQKNNWPMIPATVGCVRSTAPNINNTISP